MIFFTKRSSITPLEHRRLFQKIHVACPRFQAYADLSSSFTSRADVASSLDTTSTGAFSTSLDTASLDTSVFTDSSNGDFVLDSIPNFHLQQQQQPQTQTGTVPTPQQQQLKEELLQRRHYYLTHAVSAPRPYLHDSFNVPPCMTHSVDYVNDTAKLESTSQSSSPVFYSQTSIPSARTEHGRLKHSRSDTGDTSPRRGNHDTGEVHSNTLPRRGKSKTCVFESHGRLSDANARSLDLLDEALSKCDEEFSNLQSHLTQDLGAVPGIQGSTCTLQSTSTQTLHSGSNPSVPQGTTPGHVCGAGVSDRTMPSRSQSYMEDYLDPVCQNCTKHSNTSQSMSALQKGGKPKQQVAVAMDTRQHQHHPSNQQNQYSVSLSHVIPGQPQTTVSRGVPPEFTHARGREVNGVGLGGAAATHSEASFLNPNLPLQYVDLGRFDGKAEGQWTHSALQPKSASAEGYMQPRDGVRAHKPAAQPRSRSVEGYDQPRQEANLEGYHVMNGSVTTLPPSGRNVQNGAAPFASTAATNGDVLHGTMAQVGNGGRSGGKSPSQFTPEYQQQLILEQARQQAQQDLQHSYVNIGASLPKNMSSSVRNHYVNVSIHHMNMNQYVNVTPENLHQTVTSSNMAVTPASRDVRADAPNAQGLVSGSGDTGNKEKDWRKHMLAYHNSLKRPRSADSRSRGSASDGGKDSTHPAVPFTRSRGKSLDNIFSGSEFDVVMPIHINDESNGERSSGPKSPRRSMSVDSAQVESERAAAPHRPVLPPRSKKPPVSLPVGGAGAAAGGAASPALPAKRGLVRPQTAPSLGRLVSPTTPGSGSVSPRSGALTPASPPPTSGGADYMMMQGFPREDSESPIFCAVELPRRNASFSSYGTRSRNTSFSSAYSSEDQASYMDMAPVGGAARCGSSRGSPGRDLRRKARLVREASVELPPKPKLMQSRSLDNELDENYLRMDVGGRPGSSSGRSAHEDYMCMSPSGAESQDEGQLVASSGDELDNDNRSTGSGGAGGGAEVKTAALPFDNLIDHVPYTNRQKIFVPKTKGNSAGSSTPPPPDPPTSQSKRFFSRLIRRNSSKDRKSSKTSGTEECISPPNEPAIPEGTTTDTVSGPRQFTMGTPTQYRKASWDGRRSPVEHTYDYPIVPGVGTAKGRSMSYSTGMPAPTRANPSGTLPYQGSNLTDEEKQHTSTLLSRMGLTSPTQSAGSPEPMRSSVSKGGANAYDPALPTKDLAYSPPPKMVDSPAYMLVVPGQIPTTMTNSDHKFMSKSDIVSQAHAQIEHDYCEPDLPPTLPRKSGKRRKSRDVVLTSPTSSFLSGSSRSSSHDRNLSSPATSGDLLYATDDGKASSTSSSAATSPRGAAVTSPRLPGDSWLVNIPAAQQPDHHPGNSDSEDVWVQRAPMNPQGERLFQLNVNK